MKIRILALGLIGGVALVTVSNRITTAESKSFGLPASASSQDADGKVLYLKNCRQCHGATGQPSGENKEKYPKIKTLKDAAFLATISDDSMLTVLKKGKGTDMKSWSDKLNPAEMAAVIKYVRTLPGR